MSAEREWSLPWRLSQQPVTERRKSLTLETFAVPSVARECSSEHGPLADRLFFRRFILNDVPMLDKNPGHTETEGNATAGTFEGGAGAVRAGKTPLGRLGRVTDIAPLAVFLASDESAWITGEVIRAAGGLVVAT